MKRHLQVILLICISMLTLCACQTEAEPATASDAAVELPPIAEATPSVQFDITDLSRADLGAYQGGDATKLASFSSGALYMVYGANGFDSTGIFFQSGEDDVQLVGECGGKWTFEAVEGTLDCPVSLYVANFDYNGIDAVDKYANVIFQFNNEKRRFAPYLTKSCSNVLIQEEYQGVKVAWVFWSDDTSVDPVYYLIPFNLVTGEKYGNYVAQYKELTTLSTMNKPEAYLVCDIDFNDDAKTVIRVTRSIIDAQGSVLQNEIFYCDTFTGQYSH